MFVFFYLMIFVCDLLQAPYNVLLYKDKPRLGTALELFKATQELEQRLEEVTLYHWLDILYCLITFLS